MIEIQLQLKPDGIVEIIEKSGGIKKQHQNPITKHAKEQRQGWGRDIENQPFTA